MLRRRGALGELLDRGVDGAFLGPVRVGVGLMLFWHGMVAARELQERGYFGDAFHMSLLPEALVPNKATFTALVALRCVLGALVVLGAGARAGLLASALLVFYTLALNTLDFHHNRYSLACYALLLALTPCDRAFVLTDPLPEQRDGHARVGLSWGVTLCQLQVCIVYLASGGSKLLDPDWRAGLVLYERFKMFGPGAEARGVPHALMAALTTPIAASALAKVAVFTELALPLLLMTRRTRAIALYWGVWFHLVIQVTSQVEIFSVLTLTMYGVFVTGDVRARALRYDPTSVTARALAAVVRATDWFSRFEVKPWEPDGLTTRRRIVVVRRDGTRATRLAALVMLARGLPAFFLLWAPLALVASFGRGAEVGGEA